MSKCCDQIRLVLKDVLYFRFDFRKRSIDKKCIDYSIDLIIGIIRCTCTKNGWQFHYMILDKTINTIEYLTKSLYLGYLME